MHQKLTITVEPEVYAGLHSIIGRGNISRFLNDLARQHIKHKDLEAQYAAMAADEEAEAEALEWCEAVMDDIADDPYGDEDTKTW